SGGRIGQLQGSRSRVGFRQSGKYSVDSCREASVHQAVEEVLYFLALLHSAIHAVEMAAKLLSTGQRLQLPADMLARDAYALFQTIKFLQGVEMGQQQGLLPRQPGRRQMFTVTQVVIDLTEDPGAALGSAADHHRVGTGMVEDLSG